MRAILLAFLTLLLTAPTPLLAQSEIATDLFRYDVPQLQRVNRAVDVLVASGADLKNYDKVLYSEEKEGRYLIIFTTSVVFAEDGPILGPDIEMLFDADTEGLIAVMVAAPPNPPAEN